ncbi:hypothetical protein UA08_05716 [Talaromyces atroroseus]|uniref:Xylanolytic transcriptional activator regulatory domain-containing protein n=1 Tax=Talaromyces atroroseus TaxID=1441469 RepID=A0A225AX50_TALAT|nr:hypothetical protein UA08_05716 [Talaromyces atroroseus]OKL59025.1 hypothetical protein UA08_05716 [Talaromyces atroroseus]
MKEQISTLQDQVNTLFTKLNELSSYETPLDAVQFGSEQPSAPSPPEARHPQFHGPTPSPFNFDVARLNLREIGLASNETTIHDDLAPTPAESTQPNLRHAGSTRLRAMHPTKDPIWAIDREEAIRLCRVYEEEIGLMYPFFNINKIISQTNLLYNFLEAATRTGFAQAQMPGLDGLQDDDSLNLKIILATTLVLEGGGQCELGQQLFETVKLAYHAKSLEPASVKSIQLSSVMTMYHFHTDNELASYRTIGPTARACFELGLHRWDTVMKDFPVEEDRAEVIRLFWSIYNLDRRLSFGTGLPFVIQDDDIDPNLPEPDDSRPYSKSMVTYDRLGSKVWYSGVGSKGSIDVNREEINFLDYQVCQWYKSTPDNIKISTDSPSNGSANRGFQRLRVLLYLRMNHLRILIYRSVLHSASSIVENQVHARTVVNISRDTIRVLARLNQTSDIYKTQQITFNYFLVTALAVLFLAVCHAPGEYSRVVRDEFYLALDLVSGFSTNSHISRRLWNTIKGLRKIAEKLGVFGHSIGADARDPHSSAAVAMAGLAGHPIEGISVYGTAPSSSSSLGTMSELGHTPINGLQISHELTNLFEAVGGTSPFGADNLNGFIPNDGDLRNSGEGLAGVLSSDAEFSRILSGLL